MEISRRTFVSGAGAAGITAALVGLAGCSKPSNTQSAAEEPEVGATVKPSKSEQCDIVVVGGGISGLSAAVEAAQKGASVILVEKQPEVGGNSIGAEGPFAVDSVMQKEANIDLGLHEAIQNELEFSNYRTNTQIWTNFLKRSGEDISWLMDNGVKFVDVRTSNAGLMGWHYYDGGGKAAVAAMAATAEELGVKILTSTPMSQLLQENGEVKGILATTAEEEVLEVRANSVILASGGTGANTELLSERTGFDCSMATINCSPGNTGDGMDAAIALGSKTRTACIMGDKCVYGFQMFDHISFGATRQPILWVNGFGERFVNEGIVMENIPCAFNAMFLGQEKAFSIMDQDTVEQFAAGKSPDAFNNYMPDKGPELTDFEAQIESALSSKSESVFKTDSIAELAKAIGMDATALEDTIATYNKACDEGVDENFFKKPEFLLPVKTAPFYAFKMDPLVVCAIGGIETDVNNQVVDSEGKPIANLYAVGLDGCNLYEETYNMTLSGSCNGYCIYSGRNAADAALA